MAILFGLVSTALANPRIVVRNEPQNITLANGGSSDFGAVPVGGKARITFVLKNTGTASLTNIQYSVTGANSSDFKCVPRDTAVLAGGFGVFSIDFTPSTQGTRVAALGFTSNAPVDNPFVINLVGQATGSVPIYEKVFSFTDANSAAVASKLNRGGWPKAGLIQGLDGNYYGTTSTGGTNNFGTIFRLTDDGVLTTLVQFGTSGTLNDGKNPEGGLVLGPDGNLYGTTSYGGSTNYGTVFRMTPGGVLTQLAVFTGLSGAKKGSNPCGAMVLGNDGNFYGTTKAGGSNGRGTIFRITAAGVLTTLVEFTDTSAPNLGSGPVAGLLLGNDGNFYGTTEYGGGSGHGTVFKMTPAGLLTTLVQFGTSNSNPYGGLVQSHDGWLYGTTRGGGSDNKGTAFKMTPGGSVTTLVQFSNSNCYPYAELVEGSDGNFYGTSSGDGVSSNGSVFKMTPAGVVTTLVEFTDNVGPNKGGSPVAGLMEGSDGCLYGTTKHGGNGNGTVFKITNSGYLTTLVELNGSGTINKGILPVAGLLQASDGNFYGTTNEGGASNLGTVFRMTPAGDLTTLVSFTLNEGENKGAYPYGDLIQGNDGSLYGTTLMGGTSILGTIFKMTPEGHLTTLVSFTGGNDGGAPEAGLVKGNDGNFYGTSSYYGANNRGTVFRMKPDGELTTLVSFSGVSGSNRGSYPNGELIQGTDGNFYGTTYKGGAGDFGTIFRMTPTGVFTTLVEFTGESGLNLGSLPAASLFQGTDGNFYGTTKSGGFYDCGTIFRMTPVGGLTTLHEFSYNDGWGPRAKLIPGPDGRLYGTTNGNTVFTISPSGVLTTVFNLNFDPLDCWLTAKVTPGADGNLYGVALGDSDMGGAGSIYRLIYPGPPNVYPFKTQVNGRTSASVSAKVNARGVGTSTRIEYGSDGVNFPNFKPAIPGTVSGSQSVIVGNTIENLTPGNVYWYRFRATSSQGETVSQPISFTTLRESTATPTMVTQLQQTSVQFNGIVNAQNYSTSVVFKYGTDGNNFPNTVAANPELVVGTLDTAVSAVVAGLTKGTTYYYRIVATNMAGVTVTGSMSFTTLTEPVPTTGGALAVSTTRAQVFGTVNACGSSADVGFEYGTDGINFPNRVTATPGSVSGNADTPVTVLLTGLNQGTTYHYRVTASGPGGSGVGLTRTFSLSILSGLIPLFPDLPPFAEGAIRVNLEPSGVGGWRFIGEPNWRNPGESAGGLASGARMIEFRPMPGRIQPPDEMVDVVSGEPTVVLERAYFDTPVAGSGGLAVTLVPAALAAHTVPAETRAQWRLLGESDAAWRDSGATLTGLIPGNYLIECKPVSGRATPSVASIQVTDGQTVAPTITYVLADTLTGIAPSVLAFADVSTDEDLPFAYCGQLRSNVGSSTGFVVKRRVVATAGHVVFDDGTLSAVTQLQWFFQNHRGIHEPKPQVPRGFYLSSGYAAQRIADNTPGTSSPQAQNLDFAALYFLEEAGRGGYGGFLASDLDENEFMLSTYEKIIAGYAMDSISPTDRGKLHATPATNVPFQPAYERTWTTTAIRGVGGCSGGPLFVRQSSGSYFPAAIYLGGTGQTVVRAIDSTVVELFRRAEVSGNGGDNQTGGGITHTSVSSIGTTTSPGVLKVIIEPAAARNAGAGWRLKPEVSYRLSSAQKPGMSAGSYVLELQTVNGFLAPTQQTVVVIGGQLKEVTFTYEMANSAPTISNVVNQTINEDSHTGVIPVILNDADDAESSLVLTGTSSNTTLVPNINIDVSGSGANRNVTITPAANQSGTTTITLTVTDGMLTDTDTFVLTVNSINDAPTITGIADQSIAANSVTDSLLFNIADVETSAASLILGSASSNPMLVPPANIVLGGSGSNRTLTVTPSAGQLGATTVTVTVGDGDLSVTESFQLTVTGTALETWRFGVFGTTDSTGSSADNADPDGDGQTNLEEYAAGTDPRDPVDVFKVLTSVKSGDSFTLTTSGKSGRIYTLLRSVDLSADTWTPLAALGPLAADGTVVLTDQDAVFTKSFYRVQVTGP